MFKLNELAGKDNTAGLAIGSLAMDELSLLVVELSLLVYVIHRAVAELPEAVVVKLCLDVVNRPAMNISGIVSNNSYFMRNMKVLCLLLHVTNPSKIYHPYS